MYLQVNIIRYSNIYLTRQNIPNIRFRVFLINFFISPAQPRYDGKNTKHNLVDGLTILAKLIFATKSTARGA